MTGTIIWMAALAVNVVIGVTDQNWLAAGGWGMSMYILAMYGFRK